jgi:hypothetical protein
MLTSVLLLILAARHEQVPTSQAMDQLRRKIREELERPHLEQIDALNRDVDRYRDEFNGASRELALLKAQIDYEQADHRRVVEELKTRYDSEVWFCLRHC